MNTTKFTAIALFIVSVYSFVNAQYSSGYGYDDFRTDYYNHEYGRDIKFYNELPATPATDTTKTTITTAVTDTATITITDTTKTTVAIATEKKTTSKKERRLSRKERKAAAAEAYSYDMKMAKLKQMMEKKAEIAKLRMLGVYQGKIEITPMSENAIALINKAATPGYTEKRDTTTTVSEGYGK
jgi:hypothetical protein